MAGKKCKRKKHGTTYMVPNRVFLEEIRHLKPVPELSEPTPPKVVGIRPTNAVPKGTYQPGRQARVEVDGEIVILFGSKTEELLAEHEIHRGFGKLVSLPKNADRFKNTRYEELKIKVLDGFSDCDGGEFFVNEIIKKYPRCIRGQLSIIKKQQEKYGKSELSIALAYCIERELFSANDFRGTIEYFKFSQPVIPVCKVKLDTKYSVITSETRDLSVYASLAGGGETT